MRIIRLSLPSRNKRDKASLTDQTRFWAMGGLWGRGSSVPVAVWVVLPEHRSPVFVPGYRFAHSGSPLRGTIEAEEFSLGAWEMRKGGTRCFESSKFSRFCDALFLVVRPT